MKNDDMPNVYIYKIFFDWYYDSFIMLSWDFFLMTQNGRSDDKFLTRGEVILKYYYCFSFPININTICLVGHICMHQI